MRRFAGLAAGAVCALAALVGPSAAQDPSTSPGPSASPSPAAPPHAPVPAATAQYLITWIVPNGTLDRYLQQLRTQFRQADADGDGMLSEADIKLHEAAAAANTRGMLSLKIMNADLDGDGVVTEAELRQRLRYDQRAAGVFMPQLPSQQPTAAEADARIEQEVARLMAADTDKDGRITWAEALAFTKSQSNNAQVSGQGPLVRRMLALAQPGKDTVALADLETAAEALFREIDADHNGTITSEELNAWRNRESAALAAERREQQRLAAEKERARKEAEAHAGCDMPKASDNAKVVLLSAYESDAVSTATIGSQDTEVRTGTIEVEAGDDPLYVVATSFRPVIWRLSGAIERVERLVLTSAITGPDGDAKDRPLAGATGIAAERVTFLAKASCLSYFTETPSSKSAIAAGSVRREAGKDVAVIAGRYQVSGFVVPSGVIRTSGRADRPMLVIRKQAGTLVIQGGANVVVEAGQSDLAGEVARFYPGGVVEVDPASVVASRPVARYEVLPNQPGLLQLVQRGALARNQGGEFLIKQKIRFPAGLHGAHSVKFLLLRGVPEPDGDAGHSCVIDEASGAPWKKSGSC